MNTVINKLNYRTFGRFRYYLEEDFSLQWAGVKEYQADVLEPLLNSIAAESAHTLTFFHRATLEKSMAWRKVDHSWYVTFFALVHHVLLHPSSMQRSFTLLFELLNHTFLKQKSRLRVRDDALTEPLMGNGYVSLLAKFYSLLFDKEFKDILVAMSDIDRVH